jgi:RNA polymerase-binding transcription factor DksA
MAAKPKKTTKKVAKKTTKKKATKKAAPKKATKKKTAKKPIKKAAKKASKKKTTTKKTAKKTTKKVAKKTTKKKATKKATPKKATKKKIAKNPIKKAVAKKPIKKAAKKVVTKVVAEVKAPKPPPKKKNPLTRADMNRFKKLLFSLREKISHQVAFLANSGLKPMPITDESTDSFDREQDLNLAGNEQHILNEIEEAIVRIGNKTFGMCEETGNPINRERLAAVPYARLSVKAQSANEDSRRSRVMAML